MTETESASQIVEGYRAAAVELAEAAAAGDQQALARFDKSFPNRRPTAHERDGGGVWSQRAAELVVAREHGWVSWGALLTQSFNQHCPVLADFIRLVHAGNSAGLTELVAEHGDQIRPHIDAPLFHFDAPAVVQSKNDRAMVEVLLSAGADLIARSDFWAGSFGVLDDVSEEQAKWLLDRGAELDLASAAGLGWADDVAGFLAQDPEAVHRRFGDGKTALHWAKTVEVAALLLENGADPDVRDIDHGSTAAEHLIGAEPEVARYLVERGASCDLFLAAALGDRTRAEAALRHDPAALGHRIGRPPYEGVSNDWGGHIYQWTLGFDRSPHEVAYARGHHQLYRWLMQESDDKTRLLAACMCGDEEQLGTVPAPETVVESLSDADLRLLPIAAWHGRKEAVRCFLDLGFDPHRPGAEDSTPLDRASYRGWADTVELLLERDSDPPLERRNRFGGTPLSACLHGASTAAGQGSDHVRTVKALLDAGAAFEDSWFPIGIAEIDQLGDSARARRAKA